MKNLRAFSKAILEIGTSSKHKNLGKINNLFTKNLNKIGAIQG